MQFLRFLDLLLVVVVGTKFLASTGAAELPKEPILRIEAGMHTAAINRIGLSTDGSIMATGSDDKTVRLWSLPDGRLIRTLRLPIDRGSGGKVYAIAVSPDGEAVAAGGRSAFDAVDGNFYVYVLDATTGNIRQRLGPLPNIITELEFSRDGRFLAAGLGGNNGIQVWQILGWGRVGEDADYGDPVYGLSFATNGWLATTSLDGYVRLYDTNFRLAKKSRAPTGKRPWGISFSQDNSSLAIGYDDSADVDLLATDTLQRRFAANTSGVDNGNLGSVAWSTDGSKLFAGGEYHVNGVRPFLTWSDGGTGPRQDLPGPQNTISDLAPFGRTGLAVGAANPAFGVIGDDGRQIVIKGPVTADMRGKKGLDFTLSADAKRVRFGLGVGGDLPWVFDVEGLSFAAAPGHIEGLREADITRLNVKDWETNYEPKLAGRNLELDQYETSRSLAILPERGGLLLGTDWYLRRYDVNGKNIWSALAPSEVWGVNTSSDGGISVAAYGDGTIRWHRTGDGQELLALFVHVPDKRWVAWTPTGYYAASPGGEDLIGWHVNRGLDKSPDFFPASRFRDKFYRPDIVQLVLDTLDEAEAVKLANEKANLKEAPAIKDQLPPVVNILSPGPGSKFSKREVVIDYSLRSPSGLPVDRVEVLIDGRPARGLEPVDASNRLDPQDELKGQITVTLPARDVEVGLIARSGGTSSDVSIVRLTWRGDAPSGEDLAKPKLYALVVGVSVYERPDLNLKYASKDAIDFAAAMTLQGGGHYGEVEIKLLTDGAASREAIEEGLDWLEKSVTNRDVGILFMAGHGKTDEKQRYHFIASDTDLGKLKATAVGRESIRDTLGSIAGPVIAFLDTCHSGAVAEDGRKRGDVDTDRIVNELSGTDRNAIVFASSTGREVSLEDDSWSNGAFTKALLEGFGTTGKPAAADLFKDGKITTSELDAYVAETVKALTGGSQHPVMSRPPTVPDLTIAFARP